VRFRSGINYWPRTSAMNMWKFFDKGQISDDLAHISSLRLEVVRFFLNWEDFAPEETSINSTALKQLSWFLEAISAQNLEAMPTLFTGHMSGVNWLPQWTLQQGTPTGRFRSISGNTDQLWGIGDIYTGALLQSQLRFAREVGSVGQGCEAILAWDLGNEFSNIREPRIAEDAARWSKILTTELFARSGRPVTGGTHGEDLTLDRNLRLSTIAEPWEFATMHGYSVYSDFARDRLDTEVVPFLHVLATTFSGKPVLFSEYGNPSALPGSTSRVLENGIACLDEDEMCEYARAVFNRLHQDGALGAMWWCWADYLPELAEQPPFDRAPHELRFGIVRSDGSEKPIARTLAALAAENREVLPPRTLAVDETSYYACLPESTSKLYHRFLAEAM
jgi:endo-1,4-beta-mannosidase